ncbi:hypothetical protein K3N28_01620 [Glycomyces sp. TRM65418]|uniref:hypothetical protein n=1 Tax=Glycomyces sp. TRM65418 TaxID=2867006 RepID=UPI001CE52E2A|nr:hypothetical protein [Glycomyces sp. TRM65418]MCC3761771.1 hypothetical protein [Glycomyces sp. TRM65418]QZD55855.1 hypothetical protein K3N28_01610 [Glycomyces sp. TRM65418]
MRRTTTDLVEGFEDEFVEGRRNPFEGMGTEPGEDYHLRDGNAWSWTGAPVAEHSYRASAHDRHGVAERRRFGFAAGVRV